MGLSEARGLVLSRVIRGGIGGSGRRRTPDFDAANQCGGDVIEHRFPASATDVTAMITDVQSIND